MSQCTLLNWRFISKRQIKSQTLSIFLPPAIASAQRLQEHPLQHQPGLCNVKDQLRRCKPDRGQIPRHKTTYHSSSSPNSLEVTRLVIEGRTLHCVSVIHPHQVFTRYIRVQKCAPLLPARFHIVVQELLLRYRGVNLLIVLVVHTSGL